MASVTVYPSANSGALRSSSATYATARAGTGTLAAQAANDARCGQYLTGGTYHCYQHFLEFDLTSAVPAGSTITAATLSLFVWAIDGTPGYVIEAMASDYGAALTTADIVAGANMGALTALANWTSAAPDTVYKAFTSTGLVAWLTPGATNRMVIAGQRQRTDNAPAAAEYISAYYDNTGGDSGRPKLDITYTPPAAVATRPFIGGGFF